MFRWETTWAKPELLYSQRMLKASLDLEEHLAGVTIFCFQEIRKRCEASGKGGVVALTNYTVNGGRRGGDAVNGEVQIVHAGATIYLARGNEAAHKDRAALCQLMSFILF